jgi:hypothetical protein
MFTPYWLANVSQLPKLSLSLTDSQSANLSWNKAPIWGLRPNFY